MSYVRKYVKALLYVYCQNNIFVCLFACLYGRIQLTVSVQLQIKNHKETSTKKFPCVS